MIFIIIHLILTHQIIAFNRIIQPTHFLYKILFIIIHLFPCINYHKIELFTFYLS